MVLPAGIAASGRNLERLKKAVLEQLDVIRVYTRAPGKEPDLAPPICDEKRYKPG